MENIYGDIIDSIEDGIVVLNEKEEIILFNQKAERITAISQSRAKDSNVTEIFGKNGHVIDQLKRTLETGQVFSDYDSHILKRDGSVISVSIVTSPIISRDGDAEGTVLLLRDISRIKELEEDVRRSDSLASLGIVAAGLAHEIRNPLGGIRGSAQLLQMELEGNKELMEYTSIIVRETDRVSGLIEELLDFANPKSLDLKEINIHKILDSVIVLQSKSDEGKGVNFLEEYDPSIPLVIGDGEKLSQVFLNIIKNGCEAMEGKGTMRISTKIASGYVFNEGEGPLSKMMSIEISDSGKGIQNEDMKMLFTPFFTKKRGGTGLGLAMSDRIIREHGGNIKVKSSQGEGSTFSVLLPLR